MRAPKLLAIAALLGSSTVILGAFGSHGLTPHLTPQSLDVWKTAVLYQFIHVLVLGGIAALPKDNTWLRWAGALMVVGILCFSGSLYLLSTRDLHGLPVSFLGPITPLGGLAFIMGWIALAVGVWPSNKRIS